MCNCPSMPCMDGSLFLQSIAVTTCSPAIRTLPSHSGDGVVYSDGKILPPPTSLGINRF